jgi:hypothetical protein
LVGGGVFTQGRETTKRELGRLLKGGGGGVEQWGGPRVRRQPHGSSRWGGPQPDRQAVGGQQCPGRGARGRAARCQRQNLGG